MAKVTKATPPKEDYVPEPVKKPAIKFKAVGRLMVHPYTLQHFTQVPQEAAIDSWLESQLGAGKLVQVEE